MKNNTYKLPEEDIVQAVCKKINTKDFKIKESDITIITEKHGLLCEHAYLNVKIKEAKYEKEKSLHFFVKYFPREPKQAAFTESTGAFKKEIFIYKLFDSLDNNLITDCTANYYILKDKKYIIFDDLTKENFEMISKHEYLKEEYLLVALNSLAKLHTASLVYEENKSKELGRNYRLLEDYEKDFEESLFCHKTERECILKGIIGAVDLFKFSKNLENGKDFKEAIHKVFPELLRLCEPSKKYRNVVCHGDLWSTNFLFNFSKGLPLTCKLVDFQCARYCPPAHDVLLLIYLTTSRKYRKEHLHRVLDVYYSYLKKQIKNAGFNLEDILCFKEFLETCEEQKTMGILSGAVCINLILVKNDFLEKVFNDEELYQAYLLEDRTNLVKAYIDLDEMYGIRLRENIEDLKELCENIT